MTHSMATVSCPGPELEAVLDRYSAPEEVVELPGHCYACGADSTTRMYQTHIPYFKDVIIMANACDVCGFRSSEIKPGGGISDRGLRCTLEVKEQEDLRRDVIKSETSSLAVPELSLEMGTGTMGGVVTTVEGLLAGIQTSLSSTASFHLGDSSEGSDRAAWKEFFEGLESLQRLDRPWTLEISDPLANSFISHIGDDPEQDPRLTTEEYERSAEDDERFGIQHLREHASEGVGLGAIDEGDEGKDKPEPKPDHA